MPNLLAMSFEGELAPSFDLRCLREGEVAPDGWGIGYYPGGEPSATVLKEPAPPYGSIRSELVKAWEHLESSVFLLHIRRATWGALSDANTQPFQRPWGRRDWLFAHAGSLNHRLQPRPGPVFEPVGSTDTELIFCELMNRMAERGWKSLGEADPRTLLDWLGLINEHGNLTCVLTDGHDLAIYSDRVAAGIYLCEVLPPYERLTFEDGELLVDLGKRGVKSRKGVVVSSQPLEVDGMEKDWRAVLPGRLVLLRQGAVREVVEPRDAPVEQRFLAGTLRREMPRPERAEVRRYRVLHRTVYRYQRPVERSSHLFRLMPADDRLQKLLAYELSISVDGTHREFDDVFGNRARRLEVDTPFSELSITADSRVEVLDTDPLSYRPLRERAQIPVVWMPWHQQVLQPFLLPPELAESELRELSDYAMSFAVRNDFDLIDTLLDLNHSIFKEYDYTPGVTTVQTTPFEVYASRRGVCQDFTNLFMCLARLLGVPARYVCGYIFTGQKHANKRQAEASHAWAQVYLPEVGWKGFDPTNGILTQTGHVRVAVGRTYRDATPTSGTIYVGGGGEHLEVNVTVECEDRALATAV
ncbi:MAG TPA: class II glutamine amidotransferase [Anaeromyxobacteraceae bacterium]|nr:class II glutamine amidotransferase [Anaeromyxobacteraceae bacterium]